MTGISCRVRTDRLVGTMWENIGDLTPDKPGPRAFFEVIEDEEEGAVGWYLLLAADQARALREEFGLPLDEEGHEGPPEPSTQAEL